MNTPVHPPPPRLSVGLPVYNGERFVAEAIESVLRQEFTDFELIISDNASTDRTAQICARYAAADPRVRFHRSDANRGGAWNYNRVFALSSAPFFKWQAHDDLCQPGFFRRCMEVFDRAPPSVVVVFPQTEIVDLQGRALTRHFLPEPMECCWPTPHQRLAHVLRHMTMVRPQFGLIRAAALRQTRLFDRMIAADFVLFAELALLGEFWEVPAPLFLRRLHPGISTVAQRTDDERAQWWDASQRTYRHLLSPMMRLGLEYCRSIHRLPLPPAEKLRCYATAVGVWNTRQLRNAIGRWRRRAQPPPQSLFAGDVSLSS